MNYDRKALMAVLSIHLKATKADSKKLSELITAEHKRLILRSRNLGAMRAVGYSC